MAVARPTWTLRPGPPNRRMAVNLEEASSKLFSPFRNSRSRGPWARASSGVFQRSPRSSTVTYKDGPP